MVHMDVDKVKKAVSFIGVTGRMSEMVDWVTSSMRDYRRKRKQRG